MHNKNRFWLIFGIVLFLISLIVMKYLFFVDEYVNLFFYSLGVGFLIKFAEVLSYITDPIVLVGISGVLLIVLLFTKKYRKFFVFGLGISGGILIEILLKNIIHRVRPENALINEVSFGFPSGHAMMSLIFFVLIVYLFKNEIKNLFWKNVFIWVCVVLPILICLSRLYLNVHWFSDVIGGVGLGLVWVESVLLILQSQYLSRSF
jgi:undecaprenyl-diphosphatase